MNRSSIVCALTVAFSLAGCGGNTAGGGGGGGGGGGDGGGTGMMDDGGGDRDSGGGGGGGDGGGGSPWGGGAISDDAGRPNAVNRAPDIYSAAAARASEGVTWRYPVLAQDPDGDALSFSLSASPMGMKIDAQTGLVEWTPPAGSAGMVKVTVRAADPAGLFAEQPFDLTIAPGQAPPVITSTPPLTAKAGATWTYPAAAADPDDNAFTWSVTGPNGMSVDGAGKVTWAVPQGTSGAFPVTVTVTDPTNLKATQSFTLGVAAQGDVAPPQVTIATLKDGAVITQPTAVTGTANDTALAGYTLEICRTWGMAGCILIQRGLAPVVNGVLGTIDPKTVPDGTWEIRLTAVDGAGNTAKASVRVTVKSGGSKYGALRLSFEEFRVRSQNQEVVINRLYDGVDLVPGPLGVGWRYEWDLGHAERPAPIADGWVVNYIRFPPAFEISPANDHPLNFVLADGRVYQFMALMEHEPGISSIHAARPKFLNLDGSGAKLRAMIGNMQLVSDVSYDVYIESDKLWTDIDFFTPWEPTYYQLTTDWNETFVFKANGEVVKYVDPAGVSISRTNNAIQLNGKDLIKFEYDKNGLISKATDTIGGGVVTYERDANKDLVKCTTADGSVQTFTYAPGSRMIAYEVPGGGAERFEYDQKGRVVLHVAPSGAVTQTTYDDANNKVTVTDAGGNTVVSYYDADGNVTRSIDPLGKEWKFSYLPGTHLEKTRTDPLGHTFQYEYDKQGRQTVVTNPLGETMKFTYDAKNGQATVATDGEGRTFTAQTDNSGRVTAWVLPDGTAAHRFTYPDPSTIVDTDARGNVVTRKYDDRGRLLSHADRSGTRAIAYDDVAHTATFTAMDGSVQKAALDKKGRFTSLDMGKSGTFKYQYGAAEMPDQVIRPDGAKVEYRKTPGGELSAVVVDGKTAQSVRYDALGRVASVQSPGGSRSFRYDGAGRVTQVASAKGMIGYSYDAAGRLTTVTAENGGVMSFAYDAAGRITAADNGAGGRYEATFDKSGRVTSATDRMGRKIDLTYDRNGRPSGATLPGGLKVAWTYLPSDNVGGDAPMATRTGPDGVTFTYGYDQEDRVISVQDNTGGKTQLARDAAGRVTQLTDALGRKLKFDWKDGGLASLTLPSGRSQAWTYDVAGRPIAWTRADNTVVNYEYAGDTSTQILPGGERFSVQEKAGLGVRANFGAPGGGVAEWRNAAGRTELLQTDDGGQVALEYLANGRVGRLTATTPAGTSFTTAYEYDAGAHLTGITDPDGGKTKYTWDAQERLTRIERPNGTRTELTYGPLIVPTGIQHFAGNTIIAAYSYTYDGGGRVVSAQMPAGNFQYEYDGLGRLAVERKVQNGMTVEEKRRVYDAAGNLASLTDAGGQTTFTYDADDRLVEAKGPNGTTAYSWSDRGALLSITEGGNKTTFNYDALDRLTKITRPDGKSIAYEYDADGRRLTRTDENGSKRRCLPLPVTPRGHDDCALTYAPGGGSPEALVFGPAGLASRHGAGSARYAAAALRDDLVAILDGTGKIVGQSDYDAWGNRLNATGEDLGYGYTGERHDAAAGLVFLRARLYHPQTGRFLTPDKADASADDPRALHRYLYASANPLNRTDPTGEFSLAEVSISISIGDILKSIEATFKYCVKQRITHELYTAVAQWATKMVTDVLTEILKKALLNIVGADLAGVSEAVFHNELAKLFCGTSSDDATGGASLFDFEYHVGDCGQPENRGATGVPGWADCIKVWTEGKATSRGQNGVDIVVDKKLPIELKVSKKTVKIDQLQRFCRFGSAQHVFTTVYGYLDFPDDDDHAEYAKKCWRCWSDSGCGGTHLAGAIYLAFGVGKNKQGKRFYVPDKSVCD